MMFVKHARRIARFTTLHVFYRNHFPRVLKNLQEFTKFLSDNDVEYYVCGSFLVSLLEGRIYRRFKDVDLNVDQKECSRLTEILTREGIPVREKLTGTLIVQWKGIHYDIIFFKRMDGKCIFEYKPHKIIIGYKPHSYIIEVRESALIDDQYCNLIFDKFHVRILNPTILFIYIYITRKMSHHNKRDIYCLKKYASPAMAREIMKANPQHQNVFSFGSFDYSFIDWLKDELFCIFPAD